MAAAWRPTVGAGLARTLGLITATLPHRLLKASKPPMRLLANATLLIYAAILTACAQLPPSAEPSEAGKSPANVLRLNAPPGSYYTWRSDFTEIPTSRFQIRIDRLRPSKEWNPVASLCVHIDFATQPDTCVRLLVPPHGQHALVFADQNEAGEWRRKAPEGSPSQAGVNDTLNIEISVINKHVTLSVLGHPIRITSRATHVPIVSVVCSSAVCSFNMDE